MIYLREVQRRMVIISSIAVLLISTAVGCGSAGDIVQAAEDGVDEITDIALSGDGAKAIPTQIKEDFDNVCNERPTPQAIDATIDGTRYNYTEVRAEKDEGGTITDGSQLLAKSINGVIYMLPTDEQKVYWGVRKWALTETQEKADEELENINVNTETKENTAQVVVSHPSVAIPIRYETCLVIRAPAAWLLQLENQNGQVASVDHAGNISVKLQNGDVHVLQHKTGNVSVEGQNVDVTVNSDSPAINVNVDSGGVDINHQGGAGFVTVANKLGLINVRADEEVGVNLSSDGGDIVYTVLDAGITYQEDSTLAVKAGNITLYLKPEVGLHLDAEVVAGSIAVSDTLPLPEALGVTGQRLVTDIGGGGGKITADITSGILDVSIVE